MQKYNKKLRRGAHGGVGEKYKTQTGDPAGEALRAGSITNKNKKRSSPGEAFISTTGIIDDLKRALYERDLQIANLRQEVRGANHGLMRLRERSIALGNARKSLSAIERSTW